jgi:hypothetical protein
MTALNTSSSVLFSLQQLQAIHEASEREKQEAEIRAAEALRKAREEAARQKAEAEASRIRAEEEQKARAEAERRREEARLEAIRLAAIERARVEAQNQARIEMMRKAEEHQRTLAALRADAQQKRLRRAVTGTVLGALALLGVGTGVYFGQIRPETDALLLERSAEINRIREENDRIGQQIAKNEARLREAEKALADAKSQESKAAETPAPARPGTRVVASRSTHARTETNSDSSQPRTCLDGDPLCEKL